MACTAAIKKNYRENCKRVYEGQIESSYPSEKCRRARGPTQSSDQICEKVIVAEAAKTTQEE